METVTEQNLQLYYSKDGVIIRDAVASDIDYLSKNMKQLDIDEVWVSHHKTPLEALTEGLEYSSQCLTVEKEGRTLAMFGITPTAKEDEAMVWLLSCEELFKIKRIEFIKHSAGFIGFMFHRAPKINKFYNFVDVRNAISIRWLSKIGAAFAAPKPFGAEQMPFRYFEFRRT